MEKSQTKTMPYHSNSVNTARLKFEIFLLRSSIQVKKWFIMIMAFCFVFAGP